MSRARPSATIFRPILPSGHIVRTEKNPRPQRLPRAQPPGPASGATGAPGAADAIGAIGAVPFFRESSHLGSTKGLYRSLLRAIRRHGGDEQGTCELESRVAIRDGLGSSGVQSRPTSLDGLTRRLRETWRKKASLTSLPQTLAFLSTQRSLLSQLTSTSPSSLAEIRSLSTRLSESYARAAARTSYRKSVVPPKPRLTGGYLRPTLFNLPLPRLKPQPESLSMMIHKRLRARERRTWTRRVWAEWAGDMKAEMAFYRRINDLGPRQRGSGLASGTASGTEPRSGSDAAPGQSAFEGMSQVGHTSNGTRDGGAADAARSGTSAVIGEGTTTTATTTTSDTITTNTRAKTGHDPWMGGWDRELNTLLWNMDEAFRKEGRRSGMKFKEGMVRRVERAKGRRDVWRRDEAMRRKAAGATTTSMGKSGSAASRAQE